jgi:hypothetical protein
MSLNVHKPIFIVGSPRSGTSIFYRTMAKHPDLAWISNITKKFPASMLITRLIMLFREDHRPTEANKIWAKYTKTDHESLGKSDVSPAARRYLHHVVQNNLKIFNKTRFVNKCPGNAVRIEFLYEIFPDAIFIHVVRDGRAVVHSIKRAREKHGGQFWGTRPPGWRKLQALPMLESCALQWKMIMEHILESAQHLPPDRYVEVKYEDFIDRPAQTLSSVGEKCGLTWSVAFLDKVADGLENRNFKWRENFSPDEKDTLLALLGDLLDRLGYEI